VKNDTIIIPDRSQIFKEVALFFTIFKEVALFFTIFKEEALFFLTDLIYVYYIL
jgi:hypothetical protein